jgi:hypothetical protein
MSDTDAAIQSIDNSILTPIVRRALDSDTVEVGEWDCQRLYGGASQAEGVFRFSGMGHLRGETAPWSIVLKIVPPIPPVDDPSYSHYWKREALAYQSGLLDDLPGNLVAPRCFDVAERPSGRCWVWMEDVRDDIGPEWPLGHYGVVARHLGQFNGAYLTERLIPHCVWLSHGLLREPVARNASVVDQLRESLDRPLVGLAFPPDVAEGVFRLWAERHAFLDAIDRLPRTFAHLEAFRRNLFARLLKGGTYQTVAIDWFFVGIGVIGQEIAPLVSQSAFFRAGEVDTVDRVWELDATVCDGYLQGLRDAGWRGDGRTARLGYALVAPMRIISYLQPVLRSLVDENQRARTEMLFGHTLEDQAAWQAECFRFLLALADEARGLLDSR